MIGKYNSIKRKKVLLFISLKEILSLELVNNNIE